MNSVYNLSVRLLRRSMEIPSRGLPKAQSCRGPFDETLNVDTDGIVWFTNFRSKNFPHGMRYEPCSPASCQRAIESSGIDPAEFSFIDIGCGKGRPLIIASQHHFPELIGLEYSQKLCEIARANLQKLGIRGQIVCQDAAQFEFPQRDVFVFFYHPFDARVLRTVLANLKSARRVVVAYEGAGRDAVGKQAWLKPFASFNDTALYRNF